jgi:ornithine cyclodeaminase/alanine dehydrogenase-like protein (mu-crystallin family)
MAREDARTLAVIGTGYQASSQVAAIAAVRNLSHVRVYGRDAERRAKFAAEMSERLQLPVDAALSAEAAVRDADIIVTATSTTRPVLEGAWIAPGTHINAIGANFPQKRELDEAAVARASRIAVDSIEQAKMEAGDLIQAFANDPSRWNSVIELSRIITGEIPGRKNEEEITLFKSSGIAIWDVAVAARVVELALKQGRGTQIPLWDAKPEK